VTDPSHAVFLSYASQDAEAAQKICESLSAAGIEVWFDQSELRGGDAWDRQIRERIHNCRLFIALISSHTEARDEGYFRREWRLAVERAGDMSEKRAFLLPVAIDATPERGSAVPDKFHEMQWVRLPGGETPPAFVERVRHLLSPETPATTRSADSEPVALRVKRAPARIRSRSRWLSLTLALVALGALFLGGKLWLSRHAEPSSEAASQGKVPAVAPPRIGDSIAALPFTDLSENKDQQYFADGMTEEVLDLLTKIPGLRVIGRTSSFQFRDKAMDLRDIGSALGAAYVLEGSVRKSANHVRVTAQLINARDGTHLWSNTYDSELADVLKLQDSIATDIARALQLTVQSAPETRRLTSPAAYDLYLKGLRALDMVSRDSCTEAAAEFQQVLVLEPKFLPAAVHLAMANSCLGQNSWIPPKIAFERVRAAANKAISIEPKSGAAHTELANVYYYDWDWETAMREIDLAIQLGAHDWYTLINASAIASVHGNWDKALTLVQEAIAQDPLNPTVHMNLGWWVYARTGRFKEAERSIRRALEIDPNWSDAEICLAAVLLMQGRPQEALIEATKAPPYSGKAGALAIGYFALHEKEKSDAALAQALKEDGETRPVTIAEVYAFEGDHTKAMEWLSRAVELHDPDITTLPGDPIMLAGLGNDANYAAFMERLKLPLR
jgi:TolB-like protein